jgi:L,D-transpeptidase YcbB
MRLGGTEIAHSDAWRAAVKVGGLWAIAVAACASSGSPSDGDDGRVGGGTLATVNVPVESRIAQVRLNLERLRWMPRSRGARYVLVNIPAFELRAYAMDQLLLTSAVVVGERDWPTPVLRDAIVKVDVHPRWVVPAKIARQEIVPLLALSPQTAVRVKLRIFSRDTGEELDAHAVAWNRAKAGAFVFIQEPGPDNPLGDTRLGMGNTLGIHLHSTPRADTFSRAYRATSHGCVRVQWSHDLARFALADEGLVSRYEEAIASETSVQLFPPEPVPVFLTYFTAWVDEEGVAQFRRDIYRLDGRLEQQIRRRQTPSFSASGASTVQAAPAGQAAIHGAGGR